MSFDCAIVLNATFDAAWNNKGVAYGRLGELPLAVQAFQRAVDTNPANLEAAKNLENASAAMDINDKAQQSSNTIKYEAAG